MPNNPNGIKNLRPGLNFGNKGGGRTPHWFKQKCLDSLHKYKLLDFYIDIARGKLVDEKFGGIDKEGKAIRVPIPAPLEVRKDAIEKLKEWGVGKETLPIDLNAGKFVIICDSEK
jgi:hypothetical protein